MAEGHGAVVGVALLDQHMAVEAAHLGDGKDADAAERTGGHRQNFALGDVGAEVALAVTLQAVEGDVGRRDVTFQCATGKVGLAARRLQQTVLDQLVLHGTVGAHLAGRRVAAVEAHEGIGKLVVELAGDILVVDVLGHAVVDIQQSDGVAGNAHTDIFAQGTVDIHLAGDRDAAADQAAVHIAGLKAELGRESRPALVGKGHILLAALVGFGPIQQGQFELGHAGQQVGVILALAHLGGHVGADLGDAGVVGVLFISHQQIQLGVFFHFHAQLIQALDGGIAGEEVLRTGAKGDDLEVFHAQHGPGNGQKLRYLVRQFLGGAHGVLGDVGFQVAHTQVIRTVQHAAVGVAAAVDHVAVTLGSRHVHDGAVEVFGDEGLRRLGTEVAQEHRQGVAARGLDLLDSLEHIGLVFHRDAALIRLKAFGLAGGHDVLAAPGGQGNGETVAADSHNAQADFGNVGRLHVKFLRFLCG